VVPFAKLNVNKARRRRNQRAGEATFHEDGVTLRERQ
jgi:hypothetical protein